MGSNVDQVKQEDGNVQDRDHDSHYPGDPPGIDTQVRFMTKDAEADHAALRAQGADVDAEILRSPVPMFVFRDPDGNRLRIVEGG